MLLVLLTLASGGLCWWFMSRGKVVHPSSIDERRTCCWDVLGFCTKTSSCTLDPPFPKTLRGLWGPFGGKSRRGGGGDGLGLANTNFSIANSK